MAMADPSSGPPEPKQGVASPGEASAELPSGRREERVTINKEFESYDAFIHEYVTNISRSGVFIRSKSPLPIGTKVNLHFTVIMDDIEAVEGVGEVVRVHDDPPGMGVVFTELSNYSKGLIDKLLTSQARKAQGGEVSGEGREASNEGREGREGPPSDGPQLDTSEDEGSKGT
jgi:hypothetical protein